MVDRCICFSKSFADLKEIARRHRAATVTALQTSAEFGVRCGLCKPYVARMLETGQTVFAPVRSGRTHPMEMLDQMELLDQMEIGDHDGDTP